MDRFLRPLAACFLFACSSLPASTQEPRHVERRIAAPEHVESYSGDVLLRTDGNRVLVMVDTVLDSAAGTDGLVDQWFILETAAPLATPIYAHLPSALVVHSAGALRITSPERRYEFVLDGDERTPPTAPDLAAITTRAVGIGLSHNKGETRIHIAGQLDSRGDVTTFCYDCEVLDPDPGAGGSGSAACSSGGPGATQCSATYGNNSCSVTCSSGYYACCNALPGASSCRCVQG